MVTVWSFFIWKRSAFPDEFVAGNVEKRKMQGGVPCGVIAKCLHLWRFICEKRINSIKQKCENIEAKSAARDNGKVQDKITGKGACFTKLYLNQVIG